MAATGSFDSGRAPPHTLRRLGMEDEWIVWSSGDHRMYRADYGVPTIQLGCGGVIISTVTPSDENRLHGICFSLGEGDVGQSHPENIGKKVDEIGAMLQILTTSPDSLQVMINKLTEAKESMLNHTIETE